MDLTKLFFKFEGKDFEKMSAKSFENLIVENLEKSGAKVKTQVFVANRYDGRSGRVDLVIEMNGVRAGIEIDRKQTRLKSIFKLHQLKDCTEFYCILRSPFTLIQLTGKKLSTP